MANQKKRSLSLIGRMRAEGSPTTSEKSILLDQLLSSARDLDREQYSPIYLESGEF